MISFIIPAYNEEDYVGRCVSAIHEVMSSVGAAHETVVVDDGSTDLTASISRETGAKVTQVLHRQISATRNAGVREARGDVFFFVDADTVVNEQAIRSALRVLRDGAIGGACIPRFDGKLPLWSRAFYPLVIFVARLLRQPGGTCLFCTRSAFEVVGGFSEAYYAAEDAVFVSALKRRGRFVVIDEFVVTSGRKLRAHSFWSITRLLARLAIGGPAAFRDRRRLDFSFIIHTSSFLL
jgi:glycosyltransferase involved in cell wall biosynthesis